MTSSTDVPTYTPGVYGYSPAVRLLSLLDGDAPEGENTTLPILGPTESHSDEHVLAAVCQHTKMTPERWETLLEHERDAWIEQTINVLWEKRAATAEPGENAPGDDSDAAMRPHLDRLLTTAQIAYMGYCAAGSIKTNRKSEWGPADEPKAGSRPARWKLGRILAVLRQQFPKIRPPEAAQEGA